MVRGASRLAMACGLSPLVVGLTVVAFGTSAPEFAVSAASALSGQADIAVGNVVGSNIMNILAILGFSALVVPLVVHVKLVQFEVPLMIAVSILMYVLCLDGQLSRIEGVSLFTGLIIYTTWSIVFGSKSDVATIDDAEFAEIKSASFVQKTIIPLLFAITGIVLLVLGANWLVEGASAIARNLGVSELVIGLTIVAGGTSLPEGATSLVAALRGERDIAVGNVVGSNLFNILGVMGFSACLSPNGVTVPEAALSFDLPVMVAVSVACLPIFFRSHLISRWDGGLFVAYLIAYITTLVLHETNHDSLPMFQILMLGFVIPLTVITLAVSAYRALRRRWSKAEAVGEEIT